MRRALAVITTVGALAVGGSAYASQATGTSAPQSKRAPAPQTSQVTGTLTSFDSASNMLTLSTLNGDETFTLGPTAMLHQGRKVLMTSDLANLTGHNVTVRYAES